MTSSLQKRFFRYVSGSVGGMLGLSCYVLTDTFFIAQTIGEHGLTALNLAIPVFSFITGAGLLAGIGGATFRTLTHARQAFPHAFWLSCLLTLPFFLAGLFFSVPLAHLLGADAVTLADTEIYLRTLLLFSPLFFLNNLLSAFIRNDGAPRLAMAAMLTGSFTNILLDYLFLYPGRMGMFGAVLATCLAPLLSIAVLSLHFLRRNHTFSLHPSRMAGDFRFPAAVRRMLPLGLSSLLGELSSGLVILLFNRVILPLAGNTGVAAYGILANISLVVTAIFTGIAQGVQPLVSEACRKQDAVSLHRLLRMGGGLALILGILLYAGGVLFRVPLVGAFNRDAVPQLAALAERGILLYCTAYIASGCNIVLASSFSAADHPRPALLVSGLRGFLLLVPLTLLGAFRFGMDGVWLAVPVTEFLTMLAALLCLRVFRQSSAPYRHP